MTKPSFTNETREHISVLSEHNRNLGSGDATHKAILQDIAATINDKVSDGTIPLNKIASFTKLPEAIRKIISFGDASVKLGHLRKKI